jgi:hypothetical protein
VEQEEGFAPPRVQSAAQKIGIASAVSLFGPSWINFVFFASFLGLSNFGFFARFWSHIPPKKSRASEKKSGKKGHPKMVEKIRGISDLLTNREFWLSRFHHFFWRNFHKLFDFCHEIFDIFSTTPELQIRAKRPKLDGSQKRPKKDQKGPTPVEQEEGFAPPRVLSAAQ